jgi:protein-disulfide isomerase
MKFYFRPLAVALVVLAAATSTFDRARAQFSADQKGEIEKIIRDYLLRNPEILQEVIQEMERRQAQAEAEKHKEAIKEHAELLFNSRRQIVLGNPQGDVTMVEFFDYNCGFCRKALTDKLELIKNDPRLRLVLKEFPVLGEGSTQAAQIAVSVRLQDKTGGKKYLEFHQKMFASRGQIDKARALAVVREIGLDAARAEREMGSDEVRATLEEGFKLAEALGINGTPTYVLAGQVVVGAVGVEKLRDAINTVRCGKATC